MLTGFIQLGMGPGIMSTLMNFLVDKRQDISLLFGRLSYYQEVLRSVELGIKTCRFYRDRL